MVRWPAPANDCVRVSATSTAHSTERPGSNSQASCDKLVISSGIEFINKPAGRGTDLPWESRTAMTGPKVPLSVS